MPFSNMVSAPTSSLRFCARDGAPLECLREWRPARIEISVPTAHWHQTTLRVNGHSLEIFQRRLSGQDRLVADWEPAGVGHYRFRLTWPEGKEEHVVTIWPEKISREGFRQLLDDLQNRLPATIAIDLQRAGALSGLEIRDPKDITLAEELERLRVAVTGRDNQCGLIGILTRLAGDHHRVGVATSLWTRRHQVRRPTADGITRSLRVAGNLDDRGNLAHVYDTRIEFSVDTYENRLVKTYLHQVEQRLRTVRRLLSAGASSAVQEEAGDMLERLQHARRQAAFLEGVSLPAAVPQRLTMVLIKVAPYRAALQGLLEFNKAKTVQFENVALEAPLENLPYLYEIRGSLLVLAEVLRVAGEIGYQVKAQRLCVRRAGSVYVDILVGKRPALSLVHPEWGSEVDVSPQHSFGSTRRAIGSISFTQIPDLTMRVQHPGKPASFYLFDSKYKLDSESEAGPNGRDPRPTKADIDKMHAYRDAIRDQNGKRVVRYAAILYPGPYVSYSPGLEALQDDPLRAEDLQRRVAQKLRGWLTADTLSKEEPA